MAATLPASRAVAWTALDALEATCLLYAGTRLAQGRGGHPPAAAGAAALLLADATVDLLTAAPGAERALAVVMAMGAELPLAALCAVLARQPCTAPGPPAPSARPAADRVRGPGRPRSRIRVPRY
ncbi:hypothetical protein [Streptomyces beijiangensis]|uniref:Uncharacterized protein n=2 Tax=Streptomyces beijiangensis TaxID=163361 RepID=A0A939JKB4_9ACTN|nr:hypothetical protein [Streptomyces beijiangensis]MBO0514504.1 hypothetical protein [Streptomyces beijiangensis]